MWDSIEGLFLGSVQKNLEMKLSLRLRETWSGGGIEGVSGKEKGKELNYRD